MKQSPVRSAILVLALAASQTAVSAQTASTKTPEIVVNVFNERHPISPYVYGGNFPKDGKFIQDSGTRLSRWGGNIASSSNWKLHIRNTAADWYFENFDDGSIIDWVNWVQRAGSDAMVGVAMVDWTPKAPGLASFSVAKYGPQQKTDPERPGNGNGMTPDGKKIHNDPNDAYVPLRDHPSPGDAPGTIYRDEEIKALKVAFGSHPHIYEFDNEPEIWDGTHRDIHPDPVTYAEMRDTFLDMAGLIRSIDPKARIAGPTTCGWWFSWNSAAGPADKDAHGGVDYLQWWLGAIADADRKSGRRSLDIFDIHAYPDYNSSGTPEEQNESRLRASRGYWDPTFRSEGGIGSNTNQTKTQPDSSNPAIVTRYRAMANGIYPGTQFAITEWNYWDDNSAACSLSDADTYGVFGREKVDIATRFCSPQPNSLGAMALAMYKNFGSTSVEDHATIDVDRFTSYAALSADGRQLTVMTINKDPKNSVTARLNLVGFKPTTMIASTRAGDDRSITTSPAVPAPASYTFKPYSQTLLIFRGKADPSAADWSIDKDALMLVTGTHATLNVVAGKNAALKIIVINAQTGITMAVRRPRIAGGSAGVIDVAAGTKPGFYHYTINAKASTGRTEAQSGWIVVGDPGSMPVRNGR